MTRAWILVALALGCGGQVEGGGRRIVSIGGAITETLFALGVGDDVVAVDRTSIYPAAAGALPKVGLPGQISVEGVAAQRPTLVIADGGAAPAAVSELAAVGLEVAALAEQPSTPEGAVARLRELGALVGRPAEAEALARELLAEVAATRAAIAGAPRPRAMFVYARGHRTLLVAGEGTPAEAMMRLAGADNAAVGFRDMKPMSAETVLAARPEVIVIPTRGLESLGGVDGLLALPGIADTPAGRARRVVAVDDLALLGFGPRLGEGLAALARGLHPEPR